MTVTVVDHPLAEHLLASLRDRTTPPAVFRTLAKRLALALTLEAIRDLPTRRSRYRRRSRRRPAGCSATSSRCRSSGRGSACSRRSPSSSPRVAVGYIGLERDEASLQPQSYYRKLRR